jgi:hypothetical protein
MISKVKRSRWTLFLLGFGGWLVLWTAYYVISEAYDPIPNLAAAVLCVLSSWLISFVSISLLLITKLRWAALGYLAAMLLNGVGLLLAGGFDLLYVVSSFPFFLPSNLRP